ncbi:hypothetical protein CC2G_002576 [Coprinopsis cinerea AmutBmut pab1-1]|nr:hypothetical protein CC2G_002576 [Coprinopsis cinerea AmutBmut pab1-1]
MIFECVGWRTVFVWRHIIPSIAPSGLVEVPCFALDDDRDRLVREGHTFSCLRPQLPPPSTTTTPTTSSRQLADDKGASGWKELDYWTLIARTLHTGAVLFDDGQRRHTTLDSVPSTLGPRRRLLVASSARTRASNLFFAGDSVR